MRILIVRAGAIGDTLMATPVVTALAERHPGSTIDLLASRAAAPLVRNVPGVHEVYALRMRNVPYWLSLEKMRLARRLRRAGYDLAVVLEHAPQYYALVAQAGAARTTGFRDVRFDPALHSIANNLRAAGFDDYSARSWRMLMTPLDGVSSPVARVRKTHSGPFVGLHVGYGPARRKKHQEKRLRGWPLENFAAVGRRLVESGATVVLNGAREDRPAVQRLKSMLPRDHVFDFTGQLTLRDSAALIRDLDLLVSVDSGPAHMAAAVGTPLVVLWGPAILEQTRPIATTGSVEVVREFVPCAPCYGTPLMRTCRQNICMEHITPARVMEAVERSLTARPSLRPPA